MVNEGSKPQASVAPPHKLVVLKFAESRASELESLHSVVANRLNNDFRCQRNKRRRTTGHDDRVGRNRFRKKRRVGKEDVTKSDSSKKDEKKVSRHLRRRIELSNNPESGFCTSGDGTKRLRTHVWHAKRFKMIKLWGFHIPLGLHGRGRGSRALLKKLKCGALVHDMSYCTAVQLEGPEDMLLSVLSSVLVPSPSTNSEERLHNMLSGDIFGSAMLHHAGKPFSPTIAPVTYMWRPLTRIAVNREVHNASLCDEQQIIDNGAPFRQLWVWIHSAAFREGYDALRSACERQMDVTGHSLKCTSCEGQLGNLELIGSSAFQLLGKILQPANCISESSWHLKKCSAEEDEDEEESKKTSILNNEEQISSSAIISLIVNDPRTLSRNDIEVVPEGKPPGLLRKSKDQTRSERDAESLSFYPNLEDHSVAECIDLWDASRGICPPVEESVICMEKHHRRKEFICLGGTHLGIQNASTERNSSRLCPILLLKNENLEGSVIRWSIILPLSWVKVFWNTLVSNGAHAIGLKEKHQIACEAGLPYFPLDFPDCNAYSHFMAMEAVASDQKAKLCPPSTRPPKVPIPPPWDCVRLTFDKESSKAGNSQSQGEEDDGHGVPFKGFVARTSSMLIDFLNELGANRLLLFPKRLDQKNCMYKFTKDKEILKQDALNSEANSCKKQCFLRVLLLAHKEGVFEQGAVVCAPHITDVLTFRSKINNRELQIPQYSLKSYFLEIQLGEWDLQIPEDPAVQESYRWPIGFITTGFVRGSKKPVAGALCEATLLSRLREEQWKALPVRQRKKEVYVLVRNLRSTAYRLALATIVLEQQEEDVKFM
ncbi:ribonuclease Ps [Abeliophyllum distichum]|uniref:Ribonuclease Ps n=1 Tax=Abeliophyllum distichum TaxID=126358 RepID=A0ABD1P813_9LAMI